MIPKFRAFLIEAKTMRDVVGIDFVRNMYCLQVGEATIGEWFWYRDLELMQSTGLKDKNGVEIFEGDVVKVSDGSNEEDSYFSVVKNYADEGYPAFDIEAPSSWHYESNILAAIMGGEYETIEIIGNIWENPELLEQANES